MPIAPVVITADRRDLDKEVWSRRGEALPYDPEWTCPRSPK